MPLQDHIARGLYAAWRLLNFDSAGLAFLDVNGRGLLRSFIALLFALPLYALSLYFVTRSAGVGAIAESPVVALVIGYALAWPVFAFIAFHIGKLIGTEAHYLRFIISYNWARVMTAALWLPTNALIFFGAISLLTGEILLVLTFALVSTYRWYVIRQAFDAAAFHSILILLIDILILFSINSMVISLFAPVSNLPA